MRKRLDVTGRDGEHRVEQAGEADALRFGDKLEVRSRRIEGTAAGLRDVELSFVLPENDLLTEPSDGRLVGQLESVAAVPLHCDDGDYLGGDEPVDA